MEEIKWTKMTENMIMKIKVILSFSKLMGFRWYQWTNNWLTRQLRAISTCWNLLITEQQLPFLLCLIEIKLYLKHSKLIMLLQKVEISKSGEIIWNILMISDKRPWKTNFSRWSISMISCHSLCTLTFKTEETLFTAAGQLHKAARTMN